MEVTTRTTSLTYRYQVVWLGKSWHDAQRYCKEKFSSSLVVIDSYHDELALEHYINSLNSQHACRFCFTTVERISLQR